MFVTSQLRALEDFLVFEVIWEVADLVWKVLSTSGDLSDILTQACGVDVGKPSGKACALS